MHFLKLLAASTLIAGSVHARCIPTNTYKATLKVNQCRENKPGEVFIQGKLTKISVDVAAGGDPFPKPQEGKTYKFYKFISMRVIDKKGNLVERKFDACKVFKGGTFQTTLSRPCCDANYVYCDEPLDFIIERTQE